MRSGAKAMARPTKRDLEDLRRLRRKAGSREELIRWLDQCQEVKRGRRPLDPCEDFSVSKGPEKNLYVVHYKMCDTSYVVIVSAQKSRKGNRPDLIVSTPHQTFRAIAEYHGRHGHHSLKAFAKKLTKKFSENLGELKETN